MISQQVPEGYKFEFEEYLFNSKEHRKSQSPNNWKSFYLLDKKRKIITASWHLYVSDNRLLSPYRGTFGGFSFSQRLSLRKLCSFIYDVKHLLGAKLNDKWKIILPAQIYDEKKFIKSYQALADNGFNAANTEISASIRIGDRPFESIIHSSEKKKLRRAEKQGCQFFCEEEASYEAIYELIATCRKERGLELSLSSEQLSAIVKQIPQSFRYYSVKESNDLIAAAICVNVAPDIQYVFYGGHLKQYDKLSPAVMLYAGIYSQLQAERFRLLDFGTSPINGGTDFDLLDFKEYLGADLSLKITFTN